MYKGIRKRKRENLHNTSIVKGRNWLVGCRSWYFISLTWVTSEATNLWIVQDQGSKFACVGSAMTTSTNVQMSSLVSTLLTHWQEELNMVERNACIYYHPTWKPTSHTMATKVLRITSWVLMCSLPWTLECKKWIPIGLMGCVHTHRRIPTIKNWGSPNCVWNVMEKIGEDNWKAWKIGRIVSQTPALGLEHDKI
jgi:hypothetical protein